MIEIKEYPKLENTENILEFCSCISSNLSGLTKLQERAINDAKFWEINRNLLVQATAGTGKTLLTLVALMANEPNKRKMLYLVPYRALMNEKYMKFREYFGKETIIYRSSSDFYENDSEIFEGDCDIAVVIYEKLESYLRFNGRSLNLFSTYNLVVFDELSILSALDRGLRVFYILKTYIKCMSQSVEGELARIIGLTVPECKLRNFKQLNFHCIVEKERNAVINEAIYQSDIQEFIPKTEGKVWPFEIKFDDEITEAKIKDDDLEELQSRKVVRQLVLEHRKKGHNIIIFFNNKSGLVNLAKFIVEGIRDEQIFSGDWSKELERIKKELDDNAYGCIDEKLGYCSKYGVMVHHADLPHELRGNIEREFGRKNGKSRINIIISTETLAYGINCCADVVIVYNRIKVVDRDDYPCQISKYGHYYWRYINQVEYQNYIGRAGRLGFRKATDTREGFAYLLAKCEESVNIVKRHYYEESDDVKGDVDCFSLFNKKLKNKPHECAMYVLDNIETTDGEYLYVEDIKKSISELADNLSRGEQYAELVLNDLLKYGLLTESGGNRYCFSRLGETLKGKHFSVAAVEVFQLIKKHFWENMEYGYSEFLYLYDICILIEKMDINIISRKKDDLLKFIQGAVNYVKKYYELKKYNGATYKLLRESLKRTNDYVDNLEPVNETGYCYLSEEVICTLLRFAYAIILYEWSQGTLIKDICMQYKVRVTVGYIKNIVTQILYISAGADEYISCFGGQDVTREKIRMLEQEIKYGYPYQYIEIFEKDKRMIVRSCIGQLLKKYNREKAAQILLEYRENIATQGETNNYKWLHKLQEYTKKLKG